MFDPLVLIIKGGKEIKEAYYAGVAFGRNKEKEVQDTVLKDLNESLDRRIDFIENKKVLANENERKWYAAGYKDAKKILNRFFK